MLGLSHSRAHLALIGILLVLSPAIVQAGGPRAVAGTTYFNSSVMGQPLYWAGGKINYYVDQGALSATVSNQQAVAMVDAAAALWTAIPTAGVTLTDKGSLAEDVSGSNTTPGSNNTFATPADLTPFSTGFPVGVVFDADGSVLDTLFGTYTSDPASCESNAVTVWTDNINTDATISHAIMILNGRCTNTSARMSMMNFALDRAWGEILGLGYSQIYPNAAASINTAEMEAWPVMQPFMGACGSAGGTCIPEEGQLSQDDISELNRIYPITAANLAGFPGKRLTAANTLSIQGTISFRAGYGMQGVNVLATPLDASGNPLYNYTVSAVSGAYFSGNHGSLVTGTNATNGIPLSQYGSNDPTLQGYFDLRYIPLPPGMTSAGYLLTFEPISTLYIYGNVVGPYLDGSPLPSGTLAPVTVATLSAGGSQTLTVNVPDSAISGFEDAISTAESPRMLASSGVWTGLLGQVQQADWFTFPVRANRTFTIVTQAINEQGIPSTYKTMPALGVWDAFDAATAAPVGVAPALNGTALGETWLQVTASADDTVRLGIADMRGDGRPDYAYNGWVLYADTIQPPRLPAAGGPIVIDGMGFQPSDTVKINGQAAQITGISPNEITAIAPAAGQGITGSVNVEVDSLPGYNAVAILLNGISYDAATGDSLTLVTAPSNTVPVGVPLAFTVTALGADLTPAAGDTVTFAVAAGTATLACGQPVCPVTSGGDGNATMNITAVDTTPSVVTAALTNGAQLQAHFEGGTPPVLSALTPQLSLAAGSSISWPTQALVLNNGLPVGGQAVAWQSTPSSGISAAGSAAAITAGSGIASNMLSVGPLTEGQQSSVQACLNGTPQCVSFSALGSRPEFATVEALSGASQSMAATATPSQIVMRVKDIDGNPMAGAIVTFYQSIYAWSPPCPPHGRCDQAQLLAVESATGTSAIDGTVSFAPAGIPGVATNTTGLASTGNTSTASVTIEMHP
ncbi:IPT/TIG domain-containing protein [Terracidiphilus gabretensis]|uniref:IPT/TIG domain-containing protein n=1 Tax=Terracidiphilus gabretensis TaxID=1577687 RepID=UPI00071B9B43|nr:IPT/TIG domain-containing protein [Terracidiphilus gabretensis]